MLFDFFYKIKNCLGIIIFFIFILFLFYFLFNILNPKSNNSIDQFFEVKNGESIFDVSKNLYQQNLIRSKLFFNVLGILTGKMLKLRTGTYKLNSNLNSFQILNLISSGKGKEVFVTIPPGSNIYDIDNILSQNNVLKKGEFINYVKNLNLEGKLMPDSYLFFYNSLPEDIVKKMNNNFNFKIVPLLNRSNDSTSTLIIASILEKEASHFDDQRIITDIILKRLKLNMFLNIDATICYAKNIQNNEAISCYPLLPLDLKINSPYNTYTNKGLPPTPICNPSIDAVKAALNPIKTDYLYYLSDPKTNKTIFSKTLEEHNRNIIKYLK